MTPPDPAHPEPRFVLTRPMLLAGGLGLVLLVGGAIGLGLWLQEAGAPRIPVQTVTVEPQAAIREIMVRGLIQAPGAQPVIAPQAGIVASLALEAGAAASVGMPVVLLTTTATTPEPKKVEAPAKAESPPEDAGRAAALAAVAAAEKRRAGIATLVDKGFAAPAALERADAALRDARDAVPPPATARAGDGDATGPAQPFEAAIVAPVAGVVASFTVKPGDRVTAGQTIATITPDRPPALAALVGASFASEIRVGQTARMILEDLDAAFPAKVEAVGTVDPAIGGAPVRILADAPVAAQDRAPGSARILLERRENALLVPRSALRPGSPTTVLVVRQGRARPVAVRVTDWPGPRALIEAGLKPGDRVITTPDRVPDGARVRAD